ncbi:DnaB-like helicase C-terminal domain-containing protein [Nonomuraea dietziae]|uniref:DnaB-like helicase C-terminal domain-containing protein n=1 Tax=Nonomuraea dietziae TaxID=65515 RepID=UPI00361CD9FD
MPSLKKAPLPPGPTKTFFDNLHELHLRAGQPSTRKMESVIGKGVLSHTTIHKTFAGDKVPEWGPVELIVECLASMCGDVPDKTTSRFRTLWIQARAGHDSDLYLDESMQKDGETTEEPARGKPSEFGSVPTHFRRLDATIGGLKPGSLIAIMSTPSEGKSCLIVDLARAASMAGVGTLLFSSEMSRGEYTLRMLASEALVDITSLRTGQLSDEAWARLARRMSEVADAPMYIDAPTNKSCNQLIDAVKRSTERHNIGLVLIDGLGLLISQEHAQSGGQHDAGSALTSLKTLSTQLNLPVVVTVTTEYPHDDRYHLDPPTSWGLQRAARLSELRYGREI